MLNEKGRIEFVPELIEMLETFLADYEEIKGPLKNELERGLVMAYALGVMRCNLETVWDAVAEAPVFGPIRPRALFEECAAPESMRLALRESVKRMIDRRALLSLFDE
jgi:hypothetical protein